MKKLLSIMMALILMMSQAGITAMAEDAAPEAAETAEAYQAEETADPYPENFVVGNPTQLTGHFFTEMFGNATSDIDMQALLHGYNLVNWDQEQGVYVLDESVVDQVMINTDDEGYKTYYLQLKNDLYWNNGVPITAWDYAFSFLFMLSPVVEQIGGKIYRAEHIYGFNAYLTGAAPYLAGIQVLDDHQIAITLDRDYLPFFYELGLLLCNPYPISEIAPGCKVYDDGNGVYIGNEDRTIEEPIFNAALLRQTVLDPDEGYNSHPKVTSGPYQLEDFDGTTATLTINPYFKGTMYGEMPYIPRISYTVAEYDTMIDQLVDGEFQLLNKVVRGETILQGMELIGTSGDEEENDEGMVLSVEEILPEGTAAEETASPAPVIAQTNYPRVGMSYFTFSCERPMVNDYRVRQAIAWCMDRDGLITDYCQGFGARVDGYYGIAQWCYQILNGQLDYPVNLPEEVMGTDATQAYETALAEWEALSMDGLTDYEVDTDRAAALLAEAGWTLNKNGEAFDPETDDTRCKMIDGQLIALNLTLMIPEGNHLADTLREKWIDNLNTVGIQMTVVEKSMPELLATYYRQTEDRPVDMIYLATNFHVVFDPSISYSVDTAANHALWNVIFSDDGELWQRAAEMRKTEPGDYYGYVSKWISFQERYNEVLPAIPLYSNIYFDFYTPDLQNYQIQNHVTWSQAILNAYYLGDETARSAVEALTQAEDVDGMTEME